MLILVKIMVSILLIFISYFSLNLYRKEEDVYIAKRKPFIDYLYSISDYETLKKIGEINSFGVAEHQERPFRKVRDTLLLKYEQTKDKKFIEYYEYYEYIMKKLTVYLIIAMFSFGGFLYIVSSLFSGIAQFIVGSILLIVFGFFGIYYTNKGWWNND